VTTTSEKVVFKDYNPNQMMLLPPNLLELIPERHPVRVVDQVIEQINIQPILDKYPGGGTSSYHPKMLLKILVYGYLSNIYSSRKLESAVQENIHFMWLAGMSRPDHNTINRFRSDRLKDVLKLVFSQVVLLLADHGYVDLKEVYTDGTKLEANANKYTFVWGRGIQKNKERIARQLEELWDYTQQLAAQEMDQQPPDFACADPEKVLETIEQIDQALQEKPVDKKVRQKLKYARKNWPSKLAEYKEKEAILQDRNSYSKTDHDATFMRMKEDKMGNGQLKPGYNLQISTNKQFITHYSLHQKPNDTTTFIPHFQEFESLYGKLPTVVTADAGYGSHENYEYLDQNDIEGYVKYNQFHIEQQNKKVDKLTASLHYNQDTDTYYCPSGQPMRRIGTQKRVTPGGYERTYAKYQAKNCEGCPMRGPCHKQPENRIIEINHRLIALRDKARSLLCSPQGKLYRSQRPVDVEPVFGHIKYNKKFNRFNLRGLKKVEIEAGLIAIAHNLAKVTG
jgi:transposase